MAFSDLAVTIVAHERLASRAHAVSIRRLELSGLQFWRRALFMVYAAASGVRKLNGLMVAILTRKARLVIDGI